MAKHLIIAGMQRSGTTWLYRALDQHPSICMAKPVRPEPRFFLRDGFEGIDYEEYLTCFSPSDPDVEWLGEKSTSYSEFNQLPERIAAFLDEADDVRILFSLRDPIERAVSNIKFSRQHGFVDGGVADVLEARLNDEPRRLGTTVEGASVDPLAFLERGRYWEQIAPYVEVFGSERVKVLLSERVLGADSAIRELFSWLGLPSDVPLTGLGNRVNASDSLQGGDNDSIPGELLEALRAYYQPTCQELSQRLGLNLDVWNTCRS